MDRKRSRALRRVSSMPISCSPTTRSTFAFSTQPACSANKIDVLFSHLMSRIVSLATTGYASFPSPTASASYNQSFLHIEESKAIFAGSTERTLAVGPLRVYKAKPKNAAFIQCGNIVQPILSNSQAWCVDEGRGFFCLRIRPGSYWRIEIIELEGDGAQIAQFKSALTQVLEFETVPCPFSPVKESLSVGGLGMCCLKFEKHELENDRLSKPADSRCTSPRPMSRGRTYARPTPPLRIAHSRAASPQVTEAKASPQIACLERAFSTSRSRSPAVRAIPVQPNVDRTARQRIQIGLEIQTALIPRESFKEDTKSSSFESVFSSFPSLSPDDAEGEDQWPESVLTTPLDDELPAPPILGIAAHVVGATFMQSGAFFASLLSFPGKIAARAIKA